MKYPNRKAKIIRNSFELSQLDGIGQLVISRQHELTLLNQEAQVLLRRFAQDRDLPYGEVQAYIENLGLFPFHDHHLNALAQAVENGLPPPPAAPLAFNGVQGGGQVAAAGQPAAPPLQPPAPAQPAPVHLQNLGGVGLLPPPPMRIYDPGRANQGGGRPRPMNPALGALRPDFFGVSVNANPPIDQARREPFQPGPMQQGSFTFSLFESQLFNPEAFFITADDLALYFVNRRTSRRRPHHWDIGGQAASEGRTRLVPRQRGGFPERRYEPTAAPPLQDIEITETGPNDMQIVRLQPAPEPGSPTKKSRTYPSGVIFVPQQFINQALGRLGARANIRGADQGAEVRQQLLALQDVQVQQATQEANIQRVAATASADLAQASGSSSSNPHAGRFAAAFLGAGPPGYTPGAASSSSGAASSSSAGIAPAPPAASSGSPRRTRLNKKTPAGETVYSHRGPGST